MLLTCRNSLLGAIIYSTGDSIAALLSHEFQLSRCLGMLLIGGTLYAIEIPHYFDWLDQHYPQQHSKRAFLAQAFFNPLWIARHFALIHLFSGQFSKLTWQILGVATHSFIHALPFALLANYSMQRFVPLHHRFWASATFSAVMAIYYPLSEIALG
jgi:hypothetical protein